MFTATIDHPLNWEYPGKGLAGDTGIRLSTPGCFMFAMYVILEA
jgi:hypothetical protein